MRPLQLQLSQNEGKKNRWRLPLCFDPVFQLFGIPTSNPSSIAFTLYTVKFDLYIPQLIREFMTKRFLLSLIGPPGSGKGSYGLHLAKALNCSLIGMSDVLREMRPDLDLSSGKLVDDAAVNDSLNIFLSRHNNNNNNHSNHNNDDSEKPTEGYLLDGYPRTAKQLEGSTLMIDAAILLAVPDFLCESKLLGRRTCRTCQGKFNVNGVDRDGWCQPPTLPTKPECSEEECGWQTRLDDSISVVRSRLRIYHEHTDPIVKHFEQRDRLLKLRPYNGFKDLPKMTETAKEFLRRI